MYVTYQSAIIFIFGSINTVIKFDN